jgi:hypothetical protein
MDILRRVLNMPYLKNLDNCEFCHKIYDKNGAHMTGNLIIPSGIGTISKLHEFSSWNCLGSKHGIPVRARDYLDYYMVRKKINFKI